MPASWEKALDAAAGALKKAGAQAGGAGRRRDHQRGGVPARSAVPRRARLGAPGRAPGRRAAARRRARARRPGAAGHGARPRVRARGAAARLRPDRRRADPRPAHPQGRAPPRRASSRVASARPTALDPNAERRRCAIAPGAGEALLVALDAALTGDDGNLGGAASAAGSNADAVRDLADVPQAAREDVVIVYGERLLAGPGGAPRRARCSTSPRGSGLAGRDGAGLLELPSARQRRAACARPASPPATAPASRRSPSPAATRAGHRRRRSPTASSRRVWLHHADPLRSYPDRAAWEAGARHRADRDRARVGAHRHDPRARRRRLPRRGLRREGGHDHAPGRARAAPAPGDRPPAAGRRRGTGVRPLLAGDRRGRRARRPRPRRRSPARWPRSSSSTPCRSTPGSRSTRSAAAACAGPSARPPRRSRSPPGSRSSSTCRAPCRRRRRRAAARHLPLAVELQGGRRLAVAALPAPAPGRRALAGRRRAARDRARATGSRSAPTARACAAPCSCARRCRAARCSSPRARTRARQRAHRAARRGPPRRRPAPAPSPSRARRRDATPAAEGLPRCRRPRPSPEGTRVTPFAEVGYYEPWWIQILKALRDLRGRLPARADRAARRAQAARPLPAPLRPQPRRPVRDPPADGRHRQADLQGAVPPAHVDRLAVRARARDLDADRGRDASRSSRSRTRSTSSARRSGSTASTRASGSSTRSRSARSPSTG